VSPSRPIEDILRRDFTFGHGGVLRLTAVAPSPCERRERRCAFRGGLYATKAVASAATPPKKYLRADYCCKNQEPGCYGHLFILVFRRESGRCLLRPAAEARLCPTKRSRKSSEARTASAWPALLVQRGNLMGSTGSAWERHGVPLWRLRSGRIAVRRSNIRNPHPEYET
jgi:hypothetical protein